MTVFWDLAPCSVYRRFRDAYCLHHQGNNKGGMHLWNVGLLLRDYAALYPRRLSSSSSQQRELEISVINPWHYRQIIFFLFVLIFFFLFIFNQNKLTVWFIKVTYCASYNDSEIKGSLLQGNILQNLTLDLQFITSSHLQDQEENCSLNIKMEVRL
jgi:hypothetical protein